MAQKVANPKITIVTLNSSAGAYKLIAATQMSHYVEITEVPPADGTYAGLATYTPQGTLYQRPDDNPQYGITYGLEPEDILTIGDRNLPGRSVGAPPRTDPAGTAIVGTPYFKMKSATPSTTQVRVAEYL